MGKLILAVIAAPVVWGLVMFPFSMLLVSLFPEAANGPPYPTAYLVMSLVLSFGYSLVAGFCAAWIAGTGELKVGIGAGIALLLVGLGVQVSQWDGIPIWYHLIFLMLLVPMCIAGTRLKKSPS